MGIVEKAKAERLHSLIFGAKEIVLVSHSHPDGDAAGSIVALTQYIRSLAGPLVTPVFPDPLSGNISFIAESTDGVLDHSASPSEVEGRVASCDLLICLDFNSFSRTDALGGPLSKSKAFKVLIDHHLHPDADAFSLVFSLTEISSTCELLFWVLMAMPGVDGDASELPPATRNALMAGMTTDTNNFANSVFPSTLQMASLLLAAGTDRDAIVARLFNGYRENRLRLMGHLLDKELKIIDEIGVAYMVLDRTTMKQFDTMEGETEGFVNLPLSIGKVRMSIFAREYETTYRVSIRSKKGTSANACAVDWFHGGGHENAAGGKIMKIDDGIRCPADASSYIERAVREFFGR